MHILALNPYHAGSHAAFLEGWAGHSRHTFEVMTLPGHHWKWRMRHAAATFAQQVRLLPPQTIQAFDAVWCTSMLDLATFFGLSGLRLPTVVYFHENQLTYPTRRDDPRDQHFAITHLTSGLAAAQTGGAVAWNSAYHREAFLTAARKLLNKMPGRELDHVPDVIASAGVVLPPGVEGLGGSTGTEVPEPVGLRKMSGGRTKQTLHILWVGRWEHDKDPDAFFAALKKLKKRGVAFRLSVIGEAFEQVPECFATARKRFADEIVRWGYQATGEAYRQALREADVVVSTARHEFFGIAVVEAVAAGCYPVLPHRLAYPEVFGEVPEYFYDGTPEGLARRLEQHAGHTPSPVPQAVERFAWPAAAAALDEAMDQSVSYS